MKELISTNDVVLLSFTQDLLSQEGIEFAVLDQNMSLIEGSIGILPRRIMVTDEDFDEAHSLLSDSRAQADLTGLSNELELDDVVTNGVTANVHDDVISEMLDESDITDDLFLGGAVKIYQPRSGFRSGIDAVLLAASLPEDFKDQAGNSRDFRVLEAGCGAGVVSLSIARRCQRAFVDGIEIEHINAEIAQRNVKRNDLSPRVQIYLADLAEPISKLEILGLQRNSYDFVVANPPFYHEGEMRVSNHPLRRRAKRAVAETLEQWVRFMTAMAAPKGQFLMINRAEKLDEILRVLDGRFGNLRVFPLFPKAGEPANRVLISGKKGSKAPLKLLEGLALHDDEGRYLPEVDAICSGPVGLKGLFD